jgi:undecaprenyl-diphosphatase
MDYRVYEAVNDWAAAHADVTHVLSVVENVLVVLIVAGALALWLAGRRLTAVSSLAAGCLAFLANQAVHAVWDRPRPYESHPHAWHPYAGSTDASFPSDHTASAFGIAWLVFLVDRRIGSAFLAVAGVLSWIRVVVGFHYPGDVLAGTLMGLVAALVVRRVAPPLARAFGLRLAA